MNIYKKIYKKIELIRATNPSKLALFHKKYGVKMGKDCQVYGNVSFGSEPYLVSLGDHVKIAPNNQFITHDGGVHVLRNMDLLPNADKFGRIIIGNNVFIGMWCIILPGITVGDNVVIGAGSVLTKDIPSNCVAAGVPCKPIKTIYEYFDQIKDKIDHTKAMGLEDKRAYLNVKYNLKL